MPFRGQIAPVEMSHEKRLIQDLIRNYKELGIMGRPVKDQNDTITIKYGLSLIQILDLDERNQILTTNVWATYQWNDMYLNWTKENYGNITKVRVRNEDIWKPDVKLYNYADTRLGELRDALCVLEHTGDVLWIPQAIFKSSCSIDIRHFPFDIQTCHLKFGSWTYDGSKVDLHFIYGPGFELTDYIPSNEWEIITSHAKRNVKYYPCCPEPYVDLVFHIKIRRKVAFYNYILILPCVLLSSLTLVLFWLPPESPAKMQLGMNIFVAFFVLLLLLAESTPPAASSIPLIEHRPKKANPFLPRYGDIRGLPRGLVGLTTGRRALEGSRLCMVPWNRHAMYNTLGTFEYLYRCVEASRKGGLGDPDPHLPGSVNAVDSRSTFAEALRQDDGRPLS
ncbi:hypothetical protein ACOMHN_058652 [Nucella lapillus]